jgi:Flp pilus assembly protein TadG
MRSAKILHGGSVKPHRNGEAGQSLVELAILMVLLVPLLIGAVEFGRLAYKAIEVSNAAKAAVQYGSQNHATAGDTAGMQAAAQNDAYNLTGLTLTATISCVCSNGASSTCSNTDCSTSQIEPIITVNTQGTFDPLFYVPGLPKTFTIHGKATQKVLQ